MANRCNRWKSLVLANVPLKQPETYWNKMFLTISRNCRLQTEIKNRFIALKELNVRDVSTIVKIAECAIILHNCLELNNDNIEELYENDEDVDGDDDSNNDEEDINQNEIVMKREEERKREQLMNPNY
ncbi:unnamed protein product [Rhizophagus irregularis]|nr:unnamed protein product [Rhizophagus irregularis]